MLVATRTSDIHVLKVNTPSKPTEGLSMNASKSARVSDGLFEPNSARRTTMPSSKAAVAQEVKGLTASMQTK